MNSKLEINFDVLQKTIGHNLRIIRTARNETLEGVAAALSTTHATLSHIENGNYNSLKLDMLVALCNYYRVTLQQVMDLEMIQFFEVTQKAENGTTGNVMKQVVGSQGPVNDFADGYKLYIDYLKGEIERLRKVIGELPANPGIPGKP
jgi:transcriptional regulator with XRE-family HTH domain